MVHWESTFFRLELIESNDAVLCKINVKRDAKTHLPFLSINPIVKLSTCYLNISSNLRITLHGIIKTNGLLHYKSVKSNK